MPKLTVPEVRAARHSGRMTEGGKQRPERIGDGGGLYLQLTPEGGKSWLFRYTLAGKGREMGLGPVALADDKPGVTLAAARREVARLVQLVREGRDPIAERDTRRAETRAAAEAEAAEAKRKGNTFRDVAEIVLATIEKDAEANAKHRYQWRQTLESYAFPHIGDMPVAAIKVEDVFRVLAPIWDTKRETAKRLRGRIERVFAAAIELKFRAERDNPAVWREAIKPKLVLIKHKKKKVQHHPALPMDKVPAFLTALRAREGVAALALEFGILTAARSGEVRGARWSEINLAAAVWSIPAVRMKARVEHIVPLTPAAVAILEKMAKLRDAETPDPLVFPGYRQGKPLSDMTLLAVVKRMNGKSTPPTWSDNAGKPIVPHGFRGAFKKWALKNGWADHLSELALAHQDPNKVREAYADGEPLIEERRPMMEAWAGFCAAPAAPVVVVPFRAAAAG